MTKSEIKLVINKQINAPVEKVFQAWTNPDMIKQWFGPSPEMTAHKAEVDLNVGGEYLIHIKSPEDNSNHNVGGQYEQIIPNKKLVFNWKWEDGQERTQVTVDFHDEENNKTLITLTHRGFSEQEFADKHNLGWSGCLANLSNHYA